MNRDMQHTSAGPETLTDEYAVLTHDEWEAVEQVVGWAMAVAQSHARRADSQGLTMTAGSLWQDAAEAAGALAILRGVRERTFRSHYPAVYPSTGVVQNATVNI